jgi:hypothetical protein
MDGKDRRMKTLKQLDRRALWQAFRNLLICIGGVAIAAFMGNLSRPVEICMAVGWLLAILAVLYGIEIGKSSLVLEGKRTAKASARPTSASECRTAPCRQYRSRPERKLRLRLVARSGR